jgi:hypothetical protein
MSSRFSAPAGASASYTARLLGTPRGFAVLVAYSVIFAAGEVHAIPRQADDLGPAQARVDGDDHDGREVPVPRLPALGEQARDLVDVEERLRGSAARGISLSGTRSM